MQQDGAKFSRENKLKEKKERQVGDVQTLVLELKLISTSQVN